MATFQHFLRAVILNFCKTFPSSNNPSPETDSRCTIYFCLPFTGKLASCFLDVKLNVIFKPGRRLSSFLSFKDVIPKFLRSHVVYKYKCQCCGALYSGQTSRHLHTRVAEHLGISHLTGRQLACLSQSSVHTHINTTQHTFLFTTFLSSPLLIRHMNY